MSVELFDRLLAEHGDSPRALDWSPEGQRERFRVLCDVGIGMTDSVLDVGCGLGHFFDYMTRRRLPLVGEYTGIDTSPSMIEMAKFKLGGWETRINDVKFCVADAFSAPLPVADYVVASGVVNVANGRNFDDASKLLRACYAACRKACAVNMLSVYTRGPRNPERFYFDPEWAIREALAITPRATLRHDYKDNDFTVYLYKAPA